MEFLERKLTYWDSVPRAVHQGECRFDPLALPLQTQTDLRKECPRLPLKMEREMSGEESLIDPLGLALLPQSQTDMTQEKRTGTFDLHCPPLTKREVRREECWLDPLALPLVRKADRLSDSVDLPLQMKREKCEGHPELVLPDIPLQTSVKETRHSTSQDIPTKDETETYRSSAPLAQITGDGLDPLDYIDPLAITKREVTEHICVKQVTSDLADPLYIPTQITTYLADPLCLLTLKTGNDFVQSNVRLNSYIMDPSPLPTQEVQSERALLLSHPLQGETSRSGGLQFIMSTVDDLNPLVVQSPQPLALPLLPTKQEAFDLTSTKSDYVVTQATHPDAETKASTCVVTRKYTKTKVPLPLNCTASTTTTQHYLSSTVTKSNKFAKSESCNETVTRCSDEENDVDPFFDPLCPHGSADDGRDLDQWDQPESSTDRLCDCDSSTAAAMTVEQFETMRRQLLQQPFVRLFRLTCDLASKSESQKGSTSKSKNWKGVTSKSESRKGISPKSEIRVGAASTSKTRKGKVSKSLSQPGEVSKALSQPGVVSKALSQPGEVSKAALAAEMSSFPSDMHLQYERMLPIVRLQRLTGPQLHNGYKRVCHQTQPVSHQDSPAKHIRPNSSSGKLLSVGRDSSKSTQEKSRKARVLPRTPVGEKRYKCGTCTRRFRNKGSLKLHRRTRFEEPTHACRVCGKSFYVKYELNKHKLTHGDVRTRPFGCDLCKRRFIHKWTLRSHVLAHINPTLKPFACNMCCASYKQKCLLKDHITVTHSRDPPKKLTCQACGKVSKNAIALKRHLKSHCDVGTFECDVCGKLYSTKKVLKYHIWKKHLAESEKPFPCDKCDQRFALKSWLSRHQLVHTGNRATFTCDICKKQVFSKHGIYCHMLKHVGENNFACSSCDMRFYCNINLKSHMRTHLNISDRPYMCQKCGRRFNHSTSLSAHMYTHSKSVAKPFPCDKCDMRFVVKSQLKVHLRTHSSQRDRPFPCDKCGKRFYIVQTLRKHLMTHGDKTERRFVCDVCGYCSCTKGNLAVHVLTHADVADRPFCCDQCGRRFNANFRLRRHILNKHNGSKLFTCATCSLQFYRKTQLDAHIATHHSVKPFACAVCDSRFNSEANLRIHEAAHVKKPFACDECDKSYSAKSHLMRHMTCHDVRQPKSVYECDKCEKTYSSAAVLRLHNMTHTSITFACKLCGKKYSRKSSLSTHMLTHVDYDARRFACDVCGQRFNRNPKLARHMLSHEDIKSRPFPCNFCDLRCIRREHLKIHLLTHANKSV